jgi:hypothetical protein
MFEYVCSFAGAYQNRKDDRIEFYVKEEHVELLVGYMGCNDPMWNDQLSWVQLSRSRLTHNDTWLGDACRDLRET